MMMIFNHVCDVVLHRCQNTYSRNKNKEKYLNIEITEDHAHVCLFTYTNHDYR